MPFDFSAVSAPFRMQPGLRKLVPGAQQLTPNALGDRALTEKLRVLQHDAEHALLCSAGFDASAALQTLVRHAAAEHPNDFRIDTAGAFDARRLGWARSGDDEITGNGPPEIGACLRALPAHQRLAGLIALSFAEDFAIIDAGTGGVEWLAVCLPSRWAPEQKVGRHFTEVHAPVADNALLIAASTQLMRLVTSTDRWERFVWTITATAALDQHPVRHRKTEWPASDDAEALVLASFFRTERQTFIPLQERRQAVFTIHVETTPLADVAAPAAAARQLHDALASMSPSVLAYRELAGARDRFLSWLSRRAEAA